MATTTQTTRQTIDELVAEGRAALLAGEKARARSLLQIAVRDAPDNVEAWLWLSGTQSRPDEIAYCLSQVLRLDPDNQQAHEGLAWLAETFHAGTSEAPAAQGSVETAAVSSQVEARPQPPAARPAVAPAA